MSKRKILEQHLRTDLLLGVDAVPVGKPRPAAVEKPKISTVPAPIAAAVPKPGPLPRSGLPGAGGKLAILQAMDVNEVRPCTKCVLCEARTQTVFGEGDPDARLMFIGEGPGETEDQTGRPFVGRAGELLTRMILAMGLTRERVYIANAVKCRPPGNRTPTPIEVAACGDYLRRQIETIRPRVIVTLGAPATKLMLNTTAGITSIRGIWHEYIAPATAGSPAIDPIPVMPTFHPAYLLRAYTEENRRKVWEDLKLVVKALEAEK